MKGKRRRNARKEEFQRTFVGVFFAAVEPAHIVIEYAEIIDGEGHGGGGGLQAEAVRG